MIGEYIKLRAGPELIPKFVLAIVYWQYGR